jgi:hypothetical protein
MVKLALNARQAIMVHPIVINVNAMGSVIHAVPPAYATIVDQIQKALIVNVVNKVSTVRLF